MALHKELRRKLLNEDVPFSKRICLAHDVFTSQQLRVERKEEVALECLCSSTNEDTQAWQTMLDCLRSPRWQSMHSLDIQPAVKKNLIIVLISNLQKGKKEVAQIAAECSLVVLQAHCMEHYLSRKPKEFVQLCEAVLTYVTSVEPSPETVDLARQAVTAILAYNKRLPPEHNFRELFLDYLFMLLIVTCKKFEILKDEQQLSTDILKCLQIVVISKQHEELYQSILNYILGISPHTEYSTDKLLTQINKCPEWMVPHLLKTILHSFAISYKKSPAIVIHMFVVMCHTIGLHPPAEQGSLCVVNSERLHEFLRANNLPQTTVRKPVLNALQSMLEVLAKEEVNFEECKIGNETGREWLARLLTHVLASFSVYHAPSFIHALCPLASVDLLLLETSLPDVIEWMCSVPIPAEIAQAFSDLMVHALHAAEKQQRPNKLIGKLLDGLNSGINKNENSNIEALVSDTLLDQIQLCCVTMHSKHVASLMATLLYHLDQSCTVYLEKTIHLADAGHVSFLRTLSRMLCCVLLSTRGAQHTTPAPVLAKLCAQLDTMGALLARLSKAILALSKNVPMLESLLQLCVTWGELRLLLLHYVGISETSPLLCQPRTPVSDEKPFNVSMLHSYLDSKQWIQLARKLDTIETCKKHMVELVGQKLRVCVLLGLTTPHSTLQALAEEVALEGTPGPLQPSLGLLLPLLSSKTSKKVASKVAADLIAGGPWREALQQQDQSDSKFIGEVVKAILLALKQAEFGQSKTVLEKLDGKKLTPEKLETMASSLCDTISNPSLPHEGKLTPYLEALELLPLKQVLKSMRSACVLGVLAACCSLQDSWDLPARIIVQVLGTTGKDTPLPTTMDYGKLISWILNSKGIQTLSSDPKLQEALVSSLLGNSALAPDSLTVGLKMLNKALLKKASPLVACMINFLLPYLNSRVKSDDNKDIERLVKCRQKLSENVLRYHVSYPKDLDDLLLPAYCSALLSPDCSDQDMNEGILRFLPDLTADAIAYESPDVLVRILQCAVALPSPHSEPLMKQLWPYMCLAQDLPPAGQQCLQKLLAGASQEQVNEIVKSLLEYELEVGFGLWKLLVQTRGERSEHAWLRKLQGCLRLCLSRWNLTEDSLHKQVLPCLELLITLAKSKVELEPTLLDLCLDSVALLQLDARSPDLGLVALLRAAVTLLNALLTSRGTLLLERIPVLQQRLATLTCALAKNALPTTSMDLANQLATCAHAIEGIGVGIHVYKKDFARAAPYMVSDVLYLFESHNIHPAVKTHLEKYLHSLLRLCDEHAEHFLLRALSPASQQLLRSELEHCKRDKQIRV